MGKRKKLRGVASEEGIREQGMEPSSRWLPSQRQLRSPQAPLLPGCPFPSQRGEPRSNRYIYCGYCLPRRLLRHSFFQSGRRCHPLF